MNRKIHISSIKLPSTQRRCYCTKENSSSTLDSFELKVHPRWTNPKQHLRQAALKSSLQSTIQSYLYQPPQKIARLKIGQVLALQSGGELSDQVDNQPTTVNLDDILKKQKVLVDLEAYLAELSSYGSKALSAPTHLYNNIMDCFLQLQDNSKVKYYYQFMKTSQVPPNERTFNLLLQSLTSLKPRKDNKSSNDSGETLPEDDTILLEVLKEMDKTKDIKFTSSQSVIPVLKYFAIHDDMKSLQSYFQKMLDHGVRPDTQSLNLLMQVSTARGTAPTNFFSFMKSTKIPRDAETYYHLIKGAQTREEVEYYFQQLLKDKVLDVPTNEASVKNFNMILDALSIHNEVGLMFSLKTLMKWKKISPDIHTGIPFLKTLAEKNHVKAMMTILDELETVDPDVPKEVPYIAIMSALAQKGDVYNLVNQFNAMKAYYDIPCSFYCSMIEKLGQLLQIKEAVRYFNEAKNKFGITPELCDALMNAFESGSYYDKMIATFKNLLRNSIRPPIHSFLQVIQACMQKKKHQQAISFFNMLTSEELKQLPSIATWLIKSLSLFPEQVPAMISILERMQHEGITADIVTYNSLIYCFGKKGDIANMSNIFQLLQNEKIEPNIRTFNILISSFARNGRLKDAIRYLHEMLKMGKKPSTKTFAAMMKFAARSGDIRLMLKFYKIAENLQVAPNTEIYQVLISTFSRLGQAGRVRRYIELVKKHNLGLTTKMINAVLRIHERNGDVEAACAIYNEHKSRLAYSTQTYLIMLRLFGYRDEISKMMQVYEEMLQRGIKPSKYVYQTILNVLFTKQGKNAASQFVDDISNVSKPTENYIRWYFRKLCINPVPKRVRQKRIPKPHPISVESSQASLSNT